MPASDADQFLDQLDVILAPMPDAERKLMKAWAARQLVEHPITTIVTKRLWIDAYEENGAKHPGGYRSLTWRVGHTSPQNPEAFVFAMLIVDVATVHVWSFANVKDADDKESVIWFKEIVFQPDTTFGPVTGEALFEDWAQLLLDEDEYEEFLEKREAPAKPAHANGGAS